MCLQIYLLLQHHNVCIPNSKIVFFVMQQQQKNVLNIVPYTNKIFE